MGRRMGRCHGKWVENNSQDLICLEKTLGLGDGENWNYCKAIACVRNARGGLMIRCCGRGTGRAGIALKGE